MKTTELNLNQKVTVLNKKGEPLTAGVIEDFPVIIGPKGEFDAVKVREAGLNVIVCLTGAVRPWIVGDPEPQERRYVDQPRAEGKRKPSGVAPVICLGGGDDDDAATNPRRKLSIAGAWDALTRSRRKTHSPSPVTEAKESPVPEQTIQEIMAEVSEGAGKL